MRIPKLYLAIALGSLAVFANAAPLTEARINRVQRDVRITEPSGSSTRANEGAVVRGSQGVRTGAQSAAELLFPDRTLARLGSDTLFTFETGSRKMNLETGTLLFQIPKGVGGASIRTGAITAAITGTTGFIERGPTHYKLVLLEGTMRVFLNDRLRESMLVNGGQMLIGPIKSSTIKDWQTVQIDTEKLLKTSKLLNREKFDPLSESAAKKIDEVIDTQKIQLQKGTLSTTNLVIDGYGTTLLAVSDATEANPAATPTPAPTPTTEPTPSPVPTPTVAPTPTPVPTVAPTPTPVPSVVPSPTPVPTVVPTPTPVPTVVPTPTPVPTVAPTPTPVPTVAPTPTPIPSVAPTPTPVPTVAPTPTPIPSVAPTPTPVPTVIPTPTPVPTVIPTPTPVPTVAPTPTPIPTPVPTQTPVPTTVPTPSPAPATARYPAVNHSATPGNLPEPEITHAKPNVISTPPNFKIDDGIEILIGSTPLTIPFPTIGNDLSLNTGTIYSGFNADGYASTFLFGSENELDTHVAFNTRFGSNYDHTFPAAGVMIFSFKKLEISGTPGITTVNHARDLAFLSGDGIDLTGTLALDEFTTLTLISTKKDITLASDASVSATNSRFKFLHLYNRDSKVDLKGRVDLPTADLYIDAAKDVTVSPGGDVVIRRGLFNSLGKIDVASAIHSDYLQLDASDDLTIKSPITTGDLFAFSGKKLSVVDPITAVPKTTNNTVATSGSIISLDSADELSVSSVVSAKGANANPPANVTASGAQISLKSRRLSGTAISITGTGQLKALLNQAGTAGGKVTVSSEGGDISINGTIVAEKGTIDIQNTGSNGQIALTGATLSADVVKAGALGTNGTLTIGGGTISANTLLKLYAGGSNGKVNFTENVSLNGNGTKIISGNTVRIESGKVVTINGGTPAQIYTNNPQYTGSGGNGSTTGTFGNKGATTNPLGSAPTD